MKASRTLDAWWLGRVGYAQALALQEQLVEARIAGSVGDTLLLLEHADVLTLGRGSRQEHLLLPEDELERRGYEVHEIGRGGDVTYHGPGQLVAYPIVDLKPDRQDVRHYVWTLEETMIRTLVPYGVEAVRCEGLRGIWVNDRKIGAVGVRIRRWVTMHGFALNVTTDLARFEVIVPCGIHDREVTSLEREAALRPAVETIAGQAAAVFADELEAEIRWRQGGLSDVLTARAAVETPPG